MGQLKTNVKQEKWENLKVLSELNYTCWNCEKTVSSNLGFPRKGLQPEISGIYICPSCREPTILSFQETFPGVVYGIQVNYLERDVEEIYNQARECMSVHSYTATVLLCRKLLMHIAVEKGAKEGENFTYYVKYLDEKNYTPPDSKDWVDHIRKQGNDVNHKITISTKEDAEELINFLQMILTFLYEFPGKMKAKQTPTS